MSLQTWRKTHPKPNITTSNFKKFSGAHVPTQVLRQVLDIQSSLIVNRNSKSLENGFLISAFSLDELNQILKKGGLLYTAWNKEILLGYLLITNTGEFTDLLSDPDRGYIKTDEQVDYGQLQYLYQIGVRRNASNKGIGSKLLIMAREKLKKCLLTDVLIDPICNVHSLHFFKNRGFVEIGTLELARYRTFGKLQSQVLIWQP